MGFKFNPTTGLLDMVNTNQVSYGSGMPSATPATDPALYIDISGVAGNGGATLWGWDKVTGHWYPFRENWIVKYFTDTITPTEQIALEVLKAIADSVTVTDEINIVRGLYETVDDDVTAAAYIMLDVFKALEETIDITEALALHATKILEEDITVVAELSLNPNKSLSDSVTIDDVIDLLLTRVDVRYINGGSINSHGIN